eukprot:TRINITY_DN12800_c0_g1_i1.p2 TRINITY_DN12800_c0_g1~~TRINITY_DN12800_c0_g1_i1.p2  ORF type:complete len:67 (+),score=14.78 TRINITY_DN12800_c0_g1_i1:220-420(+)
MEWKPNTRGTNNKVALIQISTAHTCLLIHVCKMNSIPTHLQDLLESPFVLKLGVGVSGDRRKLHKD